MFKNEYPIIAVYDEVNIDLTSDDYAIERRKVYTADKIQTAE
jgi:hypothetical protein